jgi:HK97 family phage major capsid protein
LKSKEHLEKYKNLIAEARKIQDAADADKRDVTAEEADKFDSIMSDANKEKEQYERLEQLERVELTFKQSAGRISEPEQPAIDLPKETKQSYSLLRALNKFANGEKLDGLEREVSDEIAKQTGKQPQGFYMPSSLTVENYDLTTTTGSGAVGTVTDASNFIEYLRNKMVVQSLGAKILDGLTSSLSIPKQTGTTTAAWVTEGNATSASNATIGQVPLAPKSVTAFTDLSRKFIKQSSVSAENFARQDLATVIALELDRACINGSGSGAEPEGILQNSGIGSVALGTNGANPTNANMIELETKVAQNNADVGNLAYVTNAKMRGYLKQKEKVSGYPNYVWTESSSTPVNGYRALVTNQVPSDLTKGTGTDLSAMIFGNWEDLLIGMWGGLDILVDPYTGSSSGTVRLVMFQDCDIKLRHDESFAAIVDAITS